MDRIRRYAWEVMLTPPIPSFLHSQTLILSTSYSHARDLLKGN